MIDKETLVKDLNWVIENPSLGNSYDFCMMEGLYKYVRFISYMRLRFNILYTHNIIKNIENYQDFLSENKFPSVLALKGETCAFFSEWHKRDNEEKMTMDDETTFVGIIIAYKFIEYLQKRYHFFYDTHSVHFVEDFNTFLIKNELMKDKTFLLRISKEFKMMKEYLSYELINERTEGEKSLAKFLEITGRN
jgi:hypothetical protein